LLPSVTVDNLARAITDAPTVNNRTLLLQSQITDGTTGSVGGGRVNIYRSRGVTYPLSTDISPYGTLEFAVNCEWDNSTAKWTRTTSGFSASTLYVIGPDNFHILYRDATTVGDDWSDIIGAGVGNDGWRAAKDFALEFPSSNQADLTISGNLSAVDLGASGNITTSGNITLPDTKVIQFSPARTQTLLIDLDRTAVHWGGSNEATRLSQTFVPGGVTFYESGSSHIVDLYMLLPLTAVPDGAVITDIKMPATYTDSGGGEKVYGSVIRFTNTGTSNNAFVTTAPRNLIADPAGHIVDSGAGDYLAYNLQKSSYTFYIMLQVDVNAEFTDLTGCTVQYQLATQPVQ